MTVFAAPAAEPPRDRWGRYLITPVGGGKAVGHVRATTWAKTVADESALTGWKQRMVALGLAARPDLLAMVAAHPDDRGRLDGLCQDALDAAQAGAAANLGTALHAFTEVVDTGGDLGQVPELHRPTVARYQAAMDAAGVEVVPGMVERICVRPDITVAGTFDRLVTVPGRPLPLVADLKTGSSVDYGSAEWAIQLGLYATAETIWDPATDTHQPMPQVDQTAALIIHLPAQGDTCVLYLIDITAAAEMIAVCGRVRVWRNEAKRILTPLPAAPAVPVPEPVAVQLGPTPAAPVVAGPHELEATAARIDHLAGRILPLVDQPAAMAVLASRPADLPTFRNHRLGVATLDAGQLDEWERLIVAAEAVVEQPFTADANPAGPVGRGDPRVAALQARAANLNIDLQRDLQAAAGAAGVPRLTSGRATVRDLDVVQALVDELESEQHELDVRAAAAVGVLAGLPVAVIEQATGWTQGNPVSAADVELLDALADGVLGGVLTVDPAGLTVDPAGWDSVVDRLGGRQAALKAARACAAEHGLPAPRSTADVAESPMLAALTASAEP